MKYGIDIPAWGRKPQCDQTLDKSSPCYPELLPMACTRFQIKDTPWFVVPV